MILFVSLLLVLIIAVAFLWHPQFGRYPQGERQASIAASPGFNKGQFHNRSYTPTFTGGGTFLKVLGQMLFSAGTRKVPPRPVPTTTTDLKAADRSDNFVTWFGHSSYYLQVDGRRFLVDPVFSGSASPLRINVKAFRGSDAYTVQDLPYIDYLYITHDHWDHLDYLTMKNLVGKVGAIITGLGTGAHLVSWGFDPTIIFEGDWQQSIELEEGFGATILPSRHFSGRGLQRNRALWTSLALKTPSFHLYLGGDSGFDTHFEEIGRLHGPFDLAILECGQYNKYWSNIHMMPEEVIAAGMALRAKHILPVHWGKFSLALHPWNEPIARVSAEAGRTGASLLIPMIGEKLSLDHPTPSNPEWWRRL